MISRYRLVMVSMVLGATSIGCMPTMDIETLKQMRPKRPAALDNLDVFVGRWKTDGEMNMAGLEKVLRSSGVSEVKWEGDGWFLLERGRFSMDDLGDMRFMALWTYDAKSKLVRTAWVDDFGSFGTGTVKLNKKTGTWHMTANMRTPFGNTVGRGTITFPDPDTMKWTWNEYALFGLFKVSEMKGTSKRE